MIRFSLLQWYLFIQFLPYLQILICYHTLQIFPWELIIHDHVVRYFSLEDFLQLDFKHRDMKESQRKVTFISCILFSKGKYEEDPWPKYFSFFFSGGDKNLIPLEDKRRELLAKELHCNLNVRPKAPSYPRTPLVISPFHSPLVRYGKKITNYKRQYKFITWFDLGGLASPGIYQSFEYSS